MRESNGECERPPDRLCLSIVGSRRVIRAAGNVLGGYMLCLCVSGNEASERASCYRRECRLIVLRGIGGGFVLQHFARVRRIRAAGGARNETENWRHAGDASPVCVCVCACGNYDR